MDSTKRFSSRAEDYVRFRPGYPTEVAAWVARRSGIESGAHVVDLGSGTGLLSRAFLDAGYRVTGVEPNEPMRRAGETFLAGSDRAAFVDGTAEATGLDDACCDLVVSGQAFHWFDPLACRRECLRIVRSPSPAAMIWNERCLGTPFMDEYESLLLKRAPTYREITASHVDETALTAYFGGRRFERAEFPNAQRLNFEALRGRVMSSSYAPLPGAPGHDELMEGLDALFQRHALDGTVQIDYGTVIIFAALT